MENAFQGVLDSVLDIFDAINSVFPPMFSWLFTPLNDTQQAIFGISTPVELIFGVGLLVIIGSTLVKWIIDFIPG